MLDHPHLDRWQVEHLPAFHTDLRGAAQVGAADIAPAWLVAQGLVRIGDLRQRRARMPGCPPGLRPLRRRNERGAGLVNGESDDGGLEEFCEFWPSWRFNSATSARNAAITMA